MALTNKREEAICRKYRAYDETDHVHCHECPLTKGDGDRWDFRCKANSRYNRHTKEWEYDMTIDEHIGAIEDLKGTMSVCMIEPEKTEICTSLSEAIAIMRKYQKIEEIYEKFQKGYDHHMAWLDVVEVVQDENDN